MRKFYFLLAVVLSVQFVMAQITNPAPYCNSEFEKNYNSWNYMKVGGTNHNFGPMGSVPMQNTFMYYNNVVFPSVGAGAIMTIELMPYAPAALEPMYFGIFIDFNKNNVFDTDELVMRNNNTTNAALPVFGAATTAITKSITIPAGTAVGSYRMRLVRAGKAPGQQNPYTYDNNYNVVSCVNITQFNYHGCTYDFDINITGGLGVNDANGSKENSIEIYPNPVKDYLKINNPNKEEIKKISIFSASGQIVYKEIIKENDQINVSGLSKGVYFVDIETSAGSVNKKFIKE